MPALPTGFESSAAQEKFPGPLHHHAFQFQIRQLAKRLPSRDLRSQGEVVYMSRGRLVQKSPERFLDKPAADVVRSRRNTRSVSLGCVSRAFDSPEPVGD